ncbi:MAG: LamG-like jellyroll fold domain-containing protein [Spirochaetota bacterium]
MKTAIKKGTLHDMGGGLLYDEVQDLTWLADANYVQTSGYKSNGKLSWRDANTWAKQLIYHDQVRMKDISGWRLPRVEPVAGKGFNGRFSFDGSTDEGYNNISPRSELAYMFHVNLGLKGYYSAEGNDQSTICGPSCNGKRGYVVNVGPVKNLMSYIYWSGTAVEPYIDRNAWMFDAQFGFQNFYNQNDMLCPWAVHDGNVSGVTPDASTAVRIPTDGGLPVITIVAPPESRQELDTFTEIMKDRRCEFPFNNSIGPDDYWRMWEAMEHFVASPDLIAFWTFGENKGARRSIIAGKPFPLEERGGKAVRMQSGPFSGFSAAFDGTVSLSLAPEKADELAAFAQKDSATIFTVVRFDGTYTDGILAGMRNENDGDGSWGMRLDAPADTPIGEWLTLAAICSGGAIRCFVNGKETSAKRTPLSGNIFRDSFVVGKGAPENNFKGNLGGIAVFARDLNAAEIMELHNAANIQILK